MDCVQLLLLLKPCCSAASTSLACSRLRSALLQGGRFRRLAYAFAQELHTLRRSYFFFFPGSDLVGGLKMYLARRNKNQGSL